MIPSLSQIARSERSAEQAAPALSKDPIRRAGLQGNQAIENEQSPEFSALLGSRVSFPPTVSISTDTGIMGAADPAAFPRPTMSSGTLLPGRQGETGGDLPKRQEDSDRGSLSLQAGDVASAAAVAPLIVGSAEFGQASIERSGTGSEANNDLYVRLAGGPSDPGMVNPFQKEAQRLPLKDPGEAVLAEVTHAGTSVAEVQAHGTPDLATESMEAGQAPSDGLLTPSAQQPESDLMLAGSDNPEIIQGALAEMSATRSSRAGDKPDEPPMSDRGAQVDPAQIPIPLRSPSDKVEPKSEKPSFVSQASQTLFTAAQSGGPAGPAPSAMVQPLAPAAPTPPAQVAADPRGLADLGQAIEQLVAARETGRNLRPELALRHSEFGMVGMRIETVGADLRATLTSRDAAFAPAVHAAMAERVIVSPADTQQSGSHRGGEQGSGQGHQTGQGAGGQAGAGSDPRYGSSPGAGHASDKPYPAQDEAAGHASGTHAQHSGTSSDTQDRDRGIFA